MYLIIFNDWPQFLLLSKSPFSLCILFERVVYITTICQMGHVGWKLPPLLEYQIDALFDLPSITLYTTCAIELAELATTWNRLVPTSASSVTGTLYVVLLNRGVACKYSTCMISTVLTKAKPLYVLILTCKKKENKLKGWNLSTKCCLLVHYEILWSSGLIGWVVLLAEWSYWLSGLIMGMVLLQEYTNWMLKYQIFTKLS